MNLSQLNEAENAMSPNRTSMGLFGGADSAAVALTTILSFPSRAANPAMLKQLRKGGKLRFSADRVKGEATVTSVWKKR